MVLSDLSNLQVVMQPGQKQAEDFSIVDAGFYDNEEPFVDPMLVPNTKFPRRPDDETSNLGLTEGNMNVPATPDMFFNDYQRPNRFAINPNEQPLKPQVNPLQKGQDFIDIMADMRRTNPKAANKKKVERRRFF